MTKRTLSDRVADINDEVERFASFDHATRRFIAYAITLVPELRPLISLNEGPAGNPPVPFAVSAEEAAERARAYDLLPLLRSCTAKGAQGQRQRRLNFGALLELANVDLRSRRLTTLPAFIFCYERIVGPAWRELLPLAWKESVLQRRKKAPPRQLPLDPRLRDDAAVPRSWRTTPRRGSFPRWPTRTPSPARRCWRGSSARRRLSPRPRSRPGSRPESRPATARRCPCPLPSA